MKLVRNYAIIFALFFISWVILDPYLRNFQNFRTQIARFQPRTKDLFEPKSGRGVFPRDAQTAMYIIDSLKLKDYTLFGRLGDPQSKDPVAYHRINEGAWPVRHDSASHNVLGYADEMDTARKFTRICQINNITLGTY